jgi:c-di-GMP-binding flagellar brake protein YcgR
MDKRAITQVDQRAGDRHVLRVPGVLWFAGRAPIAVRTLDVSPGGVGLRHDDPVPPIGSRGKLRLQLQLDSGAAVIEADVEVRYSAVAGEALRSGLQFIAMEPRYVKLLVGVLANRPLILESTRD